MNYGKSMSCSARTGWLASAGWGLALTLLLVTVPAGAAETILSLGVLRDGKLEAKVSRAVHERLSRAGETAPPTSHLVLAERQCAVPECLDTLAGREKAQLILSARIQQSAGFSYIAAFMYDVAHQRSMDVSAVCDKCLPEALALRVGDLYDRLLRDYRDRQRAEAAAPRRPGKPGAAPSPTQASVAQANVAQSGAAPVSPASASQSAAKAPAPSRPDTTAVSQSQQAAATSAPDDEPAQRPSTATVPQKPSEPLVTTAAPRVTEHGFALSPKRKLIAGILGGIGVATLVASIALHATDGNATSIDCSAGGAMAKVCVLDNKVAYTLGYAVTSALAVSVGMTLFWPEPTKSNRSEVK